MCVCVYLHVYFHVCSVYCTAGYGRHVVCICVSMFIYVHLWFVQFGLNSEKYQWVSFILPVMLYLFVMAFSLWSFGGPGCIISGRDKQHYLCNLMYEIQCPK